MTKKVKQLQLQRCISESFRFGHLSETSGGVKLLSLVVLDSHILFFGAKIVIICEIYVRDKQKSLSI